MSSDLGSRRTPALVSIVTPVHNARRYLDETFESVVAQDHEDWEWLLVDDCSTDGSDEHIGAWTGSDPRVRLLRTPANLGAAEARNQGIRASRGRYLAFLDADDRWAPGKLTRQLGFMTEAGAYFSYTGFRYMPESGGDQGVVATPPARMRYRDALKNTTILTSTVMLDTARIPAEEVRFPDVRRGQDTALWWRLLRTSGDAHGLQDTLTHYRQSAGSLSANRGQALKRTWVLYRRHEHLPVPTAAWYFCHYAVNAVGRRRGRISAGRGR